MAYQIVTHFASRSLAELTLRSFADLGMTVEGFRVAAPEVILSGSEESLLLSLSRLN